MICRKSNCPSVRLRQTHTAGQDRSNNAASAHAGVREPFDIDQQRSAPPQFSSLVHLCLFSSSPLSVGPMDTFTTQASSEPALKVEVELTVSTSTPPSILRKW